jgi:hypothetical protein
MSELAICSLLFGAVFGLRFKVLVLLPLTLAGAFITMVSSLIALHSLVDGLWGFAFCALALQCGYLLGSAVRFTIAAVRSPRPLPRRLQAARQLQK